MRAGWTGEEDNLLDALDDVEDGEVMICNNLRINGNDADVDVTTIRTGFIVNFARRHPEQLRYAVRRDHCAELVKRADESGDEALYGAMLDKWFCLRQAAVDWTRHGDRDALRSSLNLIDEIQADRRQLT